MNTTATTTTARAAAFLASLLVTLGCVQLIAGYALPAAPAAPVQLAAR